MNGLCVLRPATVGTKEIWKKQCIVWTFSELVRKEQRAMEICFVKG